MSDAAVDRWHWTAESYEQAALAGVFGPEPKVELIDGEVLNVAATLPGHAASLGLLSDELVRRLDWVQWVIRSQLPVRLSEHSEPEPDVWVAHGPASRYKDHHPTASELALVAEISDTSLALDRTTKLRLYARSGVPEAWIVSLPERVVHRFADPNPGIGAYRVVEKAGPRAVVRAGSLGIEIPVEAILP